MSHEAIRKALAAGPTPGPWKLIRYVDADYIAACNPQAIAALLEERDQLAAALAARVAPPPSPLDSHQEQK